MHGSYKQHLLQQETYDSLKDGEILDQLKYYLLASQGRYCPMGLVKYLQDKYCHTEMKNFTQAGFMIDDYYYIKCISETGRN